VFRLRECLGDVPPSRASTLFAGSPKARVMIAMLALACFATGFVTAWLLRTGFVMTQISWAQERMERKVRYWQGEAIHARVRQVRPVRSATAVSILLGKKMDVFA